MQKTYDPATLEQRWYQQWESAGAFAAGAGHRDAADSFCIVIPPPNVTGYLHMGHAFQDTIMDLLTRYHRMCGDDTLWQVGTDHAGIATQMVVERQLAAEGVTRHELGREAFVERVWQWKRTSGGQITQQLRRMGASVDWSRERFTMDEAHSAAVREVFIRLHQEGLIYRGKRLVNWDPVLHTAISDLEVVSQEEQGNLWHLRYPIDGQAGHLTVATTRPETLLGDCAVAVHPQDERYRDLIGKQVTLPLTGRRIPIIGDDYVDPEFGSGCVKITPAHDFNDYAVWQRHRDEPAIAGQPEGGLINIFTADAALNDAVPQRYRGLDRYAARECILADLTEQGLLDRTEPHQLMVPRGDRSGSVVEPWLTDQWYVRVAPLAEAAIEAVEAGRIRFVPENWTRTYYEWMHNIQDWCISRQIWWGHRVPAWYDAAGNIYVGQDEAAVRRAHHLAPDVALRQDEDVLDTWFSSALWPFSTLGWPEKTSELTRYYPTDVLVTGFDIIFFWVARMIMMGLKFTGEVPFREVYIHGLVRDHEGQKMSKSKGNVLDPLDVIDGVDLETLVRKRTSGLMQPEMAPAIEQATRAEFPDGLPALGTDALRFTFAAQATLGRDIRFDVARVQGYRNFCTKLWNAARFVLLRCAGPQEAPANGEIAEQTEPDLAERWIRSRFGETVGQVHRAIADYRFDFAAQAIYSFTWDSYCDWYIELTKPLLAETAEPARRRAARTTLLDVLENLLRLAHPIIPFITEEIWQRVAPLLAGGETRSAGRTIMLEPYPQAHAWPRDEAAEQQMAWLQQVVGALRNLRSEMNLAPRQPLTLLISSDDARIADWLAHSREDLLRLGCLDQATWHGDAPPADAVVITVEATRLMVPLAGVVDYQAEIRRLKGTLDKLQKTASQLETKLANAQFVARAPKEVVDRERQRQAGLDAEMETLRQQLERLVRLAGQ